MSFHTDDEACRWATARRISSATKATLRALKRWHWCEFFLTSQSITYHTCRFCQRGHPEIKGLWKYGVRHYACHDCRKAALSA